jgi:hypothetical protein
MDWDHQQHKVKHSTVKTDLHHNNWKKGTERNCITKFSLWLSTAP